MNINKVKEKLNNIQLWIKLSFILLGLSIFLSLIIDIFLQDFVTYLKNNTSVIMNREILLAGAKTMLVILFSSSFLGIFLIAFLNRRYRYLKPMENLILTFLTISLIFKSCILISFILRTVAINTVYFNGDILAMESVSVMLIEPFAISMFLFYLIAKVILSVIRRLKKKENNS